MSRRAALVAAAIVFAVAAAWFLLFVVPRWYAPKAPAAAGTPAQAPATAERKITATLYYISEDGLSLQAVKREVPFGEPVVEQARHIVEAQLGPAPSPLLAPVPAGTVLRALFLTERGDAFVDLSADVTTKHPGGSLDELFTVYAIVDALTVNLPAITRVQLLVEGKEVDTIAGHVDVRHPLQKSLKWAQ
jgi:spore germination protein GerM